MQMVDSAQLAGKEEVLGGLSLAAVEASHGHIQGAAWARRGLCHHKQN